MQSTWVSTKLYFFSQQQKGGEWLRKHLFTRPFPYGRICSCILHSTPKFVRKRSSKRLYLTVFAAPAITSLHLLGWYRSRSMRNWGRGREERIRDFLQAWPAWRLEKYILTQSEDFTVGEKKVERSHSQLKQHLGFWLAPSWTPRYL